jgi:hypothetical protein
MCRSYAEIGIQAALHDPEEDLIPATSTGLTTLRPNGGSSDRIANDLSLGRQSDTVIERHHDIGSQGFLNLNGSFRRDEMCGPIQMRLKTYALVCHPAQLREAENLKPSAIRQDSSGPPGELM